MWFNSFKPEVNLITLEVCSLTALLSKCFLKFGKKTALEKNEGKSFTLLLILRKY